MSLRRLSVALALLLLSIAPPLAAAPGPTALAPPRETKDRLSPGQMEELAGPFIARLEREGLAGAEKAFEARIAAVRSEHGGSPSLQEADLQTAFAVNLYVQGLDSGDDGLRRASIAHLDAGLELYRAVLGPTDPNVAVMLSSRADVRLALNDEKPTPQALADLEDALAIRMAAFGPRNLETLAVRKRLARLRADPSMGGSAAARVAALERDFAGILADSRDVAEDGHESTPLLRLSFAGGLADNGEGARALSEANRALAATKGWPEPAACLGIVSAILLASDMDAAGIPTDALTLPADRAEAMLRCTTASP